MGNILILFMLEAICSVIVALLACILYSAYKAKVKRDIFIYGTLTLSFTVFLVALIVKTIKVFPIGTICLFILCALICNVLLCYNKDSAFFRALLVFVILAVFMVVNAYEYNHYRQNIKLSETPTVEISRFEVETAQQVADETKIGYVCQYDTETEKDATTTLPASSTKVYIIPSGNEIYYEEVITTTQMLDMNQNPATVESTFTETTYNLYIPEDCIKQVFEYSTE